jgi:hypothetical protein
MPSTKKPTPKSKPLPDAPRPWRQAWPVGLHLVEKGIAQNTRDAAWAFFHPKNGEPEGDPNDRTGKPGEGDFAWYQRFKRFPKTAHYNGWHSGKFLGAEGQVELEAKYPELYNLAKEAIAAINDSGQDMTDVPAWQTFVPESFAVMRHKANWGLGPHYDNAHDEGVGVVLMVTLNNDDRLPRCFQFTDPPGGREYRLSTMDRQVLVFGGEAYDSWMHESVHLKWQTGEAISLTIRLAGVCGSTMRDAAGDKIPGSAYVPSGGGSYSTGAPAAKLVAHERIRAKRKREAEERA